MKTSVRNRLLRLGRPVTQRLPTPDTERATWIWVLPVPDGRIRVAAVAVARELVDSGACFAEDDVRTESVTFVDRVDDVDAIVVALGGDPSGLESPWRNEFPL
ncbi:hypothetical protein [Cellulomonas telluris]|uniref:hypothetical protein n=1 Tax=Cellulomonas telluris TaxID=2306636 RepID=UPI0010A8C15F|nr:hypothetical protein [Cellulomonas telluris]